MWTRFSFSDLETKFQVPGVPGDMRNNYCLQTDRRTDRQTDGHRRPLISQYLKWTIALFGDYSTVFMFNYKLSFNRLAQLSFHFKCTVLELEWSEHSVTTLIGKLRQLSDDWCQRYARTTPTRVLASEVRSPVTVALYSTVIKKYLIQYCTGTCTVM